MSHLRDACVTFDPKNSIVQTFSKLLQRLFYLSTSSPVGFTIPKYMRYLEGTWVLDAGTTGGHIVVNTVTSKRNYLSRPQTRSFRVSDG